MNRSLHNAFDALIRYALILSLAFSPLAHPLAMAALAAPQAESASGCPHHAKPEQAGDCCFNPGKSCHCAMAITLPAATFALPTLAHHTHPVSAPRLTLSVLPAPEPPPPRS